MRNIFSYFKEIPGAISMIGLLAFTVLAGLLFKSQSKNAEFLTQLSTDRSNVFGINIAHADVPGGDGGDGGGGIGGDSGGGDSSSSCGDCSGGGGGEGGDSGCTSGDSC